jgi:hypothetical protein
MLSYLDELSTLFSYAAAVAPDEGFKTQFTSLSADAFRGQLQGSAGFDEALESFFRRYALEEWSHVGKTVSRAGPHRSDVAYQLYLCMRFFVMGHEFAHLLLGHTDERRFWNALSEPADRCAGVRVSEAERGPQQELEADVVGLEIGMTAAFETRIDLQVYFWAAQLFFHGNEWLALYRELEEEGEAQDTASPDLLEFIGFESHPPLERRRTVIVDAIRDLTRKRPGVPKRYDTLVPAVLHGEVVNRIRATCAIRP